MYSVENIEVNLMVPSVEETVDWYGEMLGWKGALDVFDDGNCTFGSVGKDGNVLNLMRGDGGGGDFVIFIHVDDVVEVYERVVETWNVESELQDTFWGGRTFLIKDVNGYKLQFVEMVEELDLEEIRERKGN